MENYPAVNIFCELWPFGTYDPNKRALFLINATATVIDPCINERKITTYSINNHMASLQDDNNFGLQGEITLIVNACLYLVDALDELTL